jgi:hypothetical protein
MHDPGRMPGSMQNSETAVPVPKRKSAPDRRGIRGASGGPLERLGNYRTDFAVSTGKRYGPVPVFVMPAGFDRFAKFALDVILPGRGPAFGCQGQRVLVFGRRG